MASYSNRAMIGALLYLGVHAQSPGATASPVLIRTIYVPNLHVDGLTGTASTTRYSSGLGAMSVGAAGRQHAGSRLTLLFEGLYATHVSYKVWAAYAPSFVHALAGIKIKGLPLSSMDSIITYAHPLRPTPLRRETCRDVRFDCDFEGSPDVSQDITLETMAHNHKRGVDKTFVNDCYAVVMVLGVTMGPLQRRLNAGGTGSADLIIEVLMLSMWMGVRPRSCMKA
ncbi:hypothetical protein BDZ89DRAFT_1033437 [Hymenopellis radicata]|nr:hypothetical protein BDZ89DRAFT_1033437 [Hymenopellis radicata]